MILQYLSSIRHPFYARHFKKDNGLCDACGQKVDFRFDKIITDQLSSEWDISSDLQHAYSVRESMRCSNCQCSARLRALAKAISLVVGSELSLQETIEQGYFNDMRAAEINSCGELHDILKKIGGLHYTEYVPMNKSIEHQDLQALTFKDQTFDIILTSDTLEHVPNYELAFQEIYRTLKTNGHHIFTLPLIFSRKTRRRVVLTKDSCVENILGPSYHGSGEPDYLVATEFGIDLLNELKQIGFITKIFFANPINLNEVNYVLVSRKA